MKEMSMIFVTWAFTLGAVSAVSLPLGSIVGLKVRFHSKYIAIFTAFGAGALIAALSVELVAPIALALTGHGHAVSGSDPLSNFFALVIGGVIGGALFVLLDNLINSKGGYLRKTSSTLAHMEKHRRKEVREAMKGVLETRPFDVLSGEMVQVIAGMLRPVDFRENESILGPGDEPTSAYIILEGEVSVDIAGKPVEKYGPGTLLSMLILSVRGLSNVGTITALSSVRSLALAREDLEYLRGMSPDFDKACRDWAGDQMDKLEQYLATRMNEAIEWTRSAASALRAGTEVPALTIRRPGAEHQGSPLAVWLGILLDGIPESLVIGAGLYVVIAARSHTEGLRFLHVIPYTLVAGLFLSNFPEALSSSANMLAHGWTRGRIFMMWFALMVMTAIGSGSGFLLAGVLSETWLVFAQGVAAGAMLTMIAAAMIPEAAAHGRPNSVGLSTLAGFLAAVLFKLLE